MIPVDKSKKLLIDKDIKPISDLLEKNLIVKVIAPIGSGATKILPEKLGGKYTVSIYDEEENPEDWYLNNSSALLILFHIGSLNSLRLLAAWKKNPRHLLINTTYDLSIFPTAPTYKVEWFIPPIIEVRYLRDYSNFNDSIPDLVQLVTELSSDNILIYALGKESIQTLQDKLEESNVNMDRIFISDRVKLFPNVSIIIDPMRHRTDYPTLTGGFRQPVIYISKQLADVRAKIGDGDKIVYRMISESGFNHLSELIPFEVLLTPLHYSIIDLYKNNLDPYIVLEDVFPQSDLDFTLNIMKKHGLIDIGNSLTPKADFVRGLPFGLRLSILLTDWIEEYGMENVYPVIVLVTMIDNYEGMSPYIYLNNTKYKAVFDYQLEYQDHIEKYFDRFRGKSDVETYLNIWAKMMEESEDDLDEWGRLNYIDVEFLEKTQTILDFVNKRLKVKKFQYDPIEVTDNLEPFFKNIYSDKLYNLDTENIIQARYSDYDIDNFSINSIDEDRPLSLYGLITRTTTSEYEKVESIVISYVGDVENQKFKPTNITY